MNAVVWHGNEDVRVDEVPDPAIQKPTKVVLAPQESVSG
jgi:threonine dehydrogenase-like Zn-dependent dehydrogenase